MQINEIENRKPIQSTKPKVGSLKRATKLTKFYLDWPRKKREKMQITIIRNENGDQISEKKT